MPTIDSFNGIKINVYNGDHRPPHIHAVYNEHETLVTIETFEVYAGKLPARQLKQVINWITDNSEWALEVFYELNMELK